MNFAEGAQHMIELCAKKIEKDKNLGFLDSSKKESFEVGNLLITYPGKKRNGDYRVTIGDSAPTHVDIIREIHELSSNDNYNDIIDFLEDVYENGLYATSTVFPRAFIEKIYWITLQEDINYPFPKQGRKLPFQRFYEGVLSKLDNGLSLSVVEKRTNNHGKGVPVLFDIKNYKVPSFYKK